MTNYIISPTVVTPELIQLIQSLPNYVSLSQSQYQIFANFNHTTQQEIDDFSDLLAQNGMTVVRIDGIETNLLQKFNYFRTDQSLFSMTPRLQITNLPTIFSDLFPALYNGFPIPIHTLGYTKMGFVLLWNKNGGTSNHDLRLVKCDNSGNLLPNAGSPDILIQGTNIPSGRTTNFDFNIPAQFLNFRGFVKIQGRSGNGTDDPIFDALFIYLIR